MIQIEKPPVGLNFVEMKTLIPRSRVDVESSYLKNVQKQTKRKKAKKKLYPSEGQVPIHGCCKLKWKIARNECRHVHFWPDINARGTYCVTSHVGKRRAVETTRSYSRLAHPLCTCLIPSFYVGFFRMSLFRLKLSHPPLCNFRPFLGEHSRTMYI